MAGAGTSTPPARVRIDLACEADGDELIAANMAARDWHAPYVALFTDAEGFEGWLGRASEPVNRAFVARTVRGGELVAVFNVTQIVMGNFCSAYLGYHGYPDTAGRGLVGEALDLVLAEAFEGIGLHRLEANIQPGNARSVALVRRAGFRQEGFSPRYLMIDGAWRDHERWAITAEDRAA